MIKKSFSSVYAVTDDSAARWSSVGTISPTLSTVYGPPIYAYLLPEKSFNPSVNPSLWLVLRRKTAEGFCSQTLQEGSARLFVQRDPVFLPLPDFMQTSPGLGATTRRVVTSGPASVWPKSGPLWRDCVFTSGLIVAEGPQKSTALGSGQLPQKTVNP